MLIRSRLMTLAFASDAGGPLCGADRSYRSGPGSRWSGLQRDEGRRLPAQGGLLHALECVDYIEKGTKHL